MKHGNKCPKCRAIVPLHGRIKTCLDCRFKWY